MDEKATQLAHKICDFLGYSKESQLDQVKELIWLEITGINTTAFENGYVARIEEELAEVEEEKNTLQKCLDSYVEKSQEVAEETIPG